MRLSPLLSASLGESLEGNEREKERKEKSEKEDDNDEDDDTSDFIEGFQEMGFNLGMSDLNTWLQSYCSTQVFS